MVNKIILQAIKNNQINININIKNYDGNIEDLHEVYKAVCELVFSCGIMSFSDYDINFFLERNIEIKKIHEIMEALSFSNFNCESDLIDFSFITHILPLDTMTFRKKDGYIEVYNLITIPMLEVYKNYELAELFFKYEEDTKQFLNALQRKKFVEYFTEV